jgi:hypothetical protein
MPQVTIEYMIMIPIMILQIFLFPLTAGWIMNTWVDSRQSLALKETASHISSSIQQVYSALTHTSMTTGTVTTESEVPAFIEGHVYSGNATLNSGPFSNSSKILEIRLIIIGTEIESRTTFPVGEDFVWQNSIFMSNSSSRSIIANKQSNGTILFSFGGI